MLPVIMRNGLISLKLKNNSEIILEDEIIAKAKKNIEKDLKKIDQKLNRKAPKSYYLVINSAANEFILYRGNQVIRKDKCSTGSYTLLKNGEEQQWMFKTPKGEFHIHSKTTRPVWKKPDWAFIEEGLPVPPPNHDSRFEYGVLGDYALNLGHGYLIHGTLYQRFLGLPVTHGCIRLNDDNLELLYNSLSLGSKVFIF
jgi:L,D-transpeptidase YbiS